MSEWEVVITAKERAELLPLVPDPSPLGPDEVSGRTLATLISAGTELSGAYLGSSFPARVGYAAVFEVDAAGENVTDLKPGDRAFCMGQHRSIQRQRRSEVLPAPAALPPAEAVFARLMGVSMTTLVTTKARPPDRVLVTGLGLVGHLAAQGFARCGYEVIACDPSEVRRRIATEAGIRTVLPAAPVDDPLFQDTIAAALECSGHEAAAIDACRIVRKGGEVVQIGTPWFRKTDRSAHELLHLVFHRYVHLRSGWEWELPLHAREFQPRSVYGNLAAALAWLGDGSVRVGSLYDVRSPADAQAAFQDLLHARLERLAVVFDWAAMRA